MPNFMDFAFNMLKNNPRVANDPRSQQIISAIQNKDYNAAQQLANDICKERGMSVEDARQFTEQGMQQFPNIR